MDNEELIERQIIDRSQSDKAFGKMVAVLRPLVEMKLKSKYGAKWEAKVSRGDKYLSNLNDPLCLLWTLYNNWPFFLSTFPYRGGDAPDGKKLVWDLKEYRNLSFHFDPKFTTQEKDKAIDNVLKVLNLVVPCTPAIDEAISQVSELIKENLLKTLQELDSHIKKEANSTTTATKTSTIDDTDGQRDLPGQHNQSQNIPSGMPFTHVSEQVEAELKQLEQIVSSTSAPTSSTGDLRVERHQKPNSTWWLLQIYDGDTLIGSYEESKTENGAKEKEVEILFNDDKRSKEERDILRKCAAEELRRAYQVNGQKPFIVRWNGDAIGKEGKKGVKQIKDKVTGEILGQMPRKCHRK